MAIEFVNPDIASLRVPVYTNADGEIAISGDTITGTKNITFSYTKYNATANELIHGAASGSSTTGIVTTFINFLLKATTDELGIKRTIVQTTAEDY